MRTTVTLDADVARLLKEEAHRRRESFKVVLNDSVRQVLRPPATSLPQLLPPKKLGKIRGTDPRRLAELAGEMEIDAHLALASRMKARK